VDLAPLIEEAASRLAWRAWLAVALPGRLGRPSRRAMVRATLAEAAPLLIAAAREQVTEQRVREAMTARSAELIKMGRHAERERLAQLAEERQAAYPIDGAWPPRGVFEEPLLGEFGDLIREQR
jgi:hypothetical protein